MSDAYIAALLNERAGYLARGLPDRAAAVDVELARLGYETPKRVQVAEPQVETAAVSPPVKRKPPAKGRLKAPQAAPSRRNGGGG